MIAKDSITVSGRAKARGKRSAALGRTRVLTNVDQHGKRHTIKLSFPDPFKRLGLIATADLDPLQEVDAEELELTPEQALEQRRAELRNGLTDMQRLFIFGKLAGLNDKNAALAAGYSLSVSESCRKRVWKPAVISEYARIKFSLPGDRARAVLSSTVLGAGGKGSEIPAVLDSAPR